MEPASETLSGRASSERLWRVSVEAGNSEKIAASDRVIRSLRRVAVAMVGLRPGGASFGAQGALLFGGSGRSEEAVAVFQELIERFGVSAEPDIDR